MGVDMGTLVHIPINNHKYRIEYVCYANFTKIDCYLWCDISDEELLQDLKSEDFRKLMNRDLFKGRVAFLSVNGHEIQYDVYPQNLNYNSLRSNILNAIKVYVDYKDK